MSYTNEMRSDLMARVIVRATYHDAPKPYACEMESTYTNLGEAFAQYYDPFSVPPTTWHAMTDHWWMDAETIHGWQTQL